ncbi:methyl-accepting chemotaxis protein [Chthonobacter albigriseus]|uniref:methyl-accepting chemotaxis protein n=1 Tax=Chthonobacter albigriseus TaxID=1683161 RepID=UPI0015EF8022|nr:methyl-accepting chemotaxis protein [Chthonobacter albigriseus]
MSKTIARLVADRKTSTKIVVSLAAILALTGCVGATGYVFIDLLQQRMDRTASTTDSMTGLQGLVSTVEGFADGHSETKLAPIEADIDRQIVELETLAAAASPEAAPVAGAAREALGVLKSDLAQTDADKTALMDAEAKLQQTASSLETTSLAVADVAIKLSRDAARREQTAKDLLKTGNRLAAAAGETEATARALAGRFGSGADGAADKAALDTGLATMTKAMRKAKTAAAGGAVDQLKVVEGLIADVKALAEPAAAGDAVARRSLAATAIQLAGRAAVLRNTAVDAFAGGIDALAKVETETVATRGIGEGASKLNASARKLMLDTVVFVGAPGPETLGSLKAQVEQVKRLLEVIAQDGAAVAEITTSLEKAKALPDAVVTGADTVLQLQGKLDVSGTAMRASLMKAAQSLTELVALERSAAAGDRQAAVQWIVGTIVVAALASILIGSVLMIVIQRPIRSLTAGMMRLADGDTGLVLAGAERKDEIGAMTRAVLVFRDNAIERQRLEAQAQAERDEREARQGRVETLVRGFETTVGRLLSQVSSSGETLQSTADRLNGIAGTTAAKAESAASASNQASANVQTVASAAEELSASIGAISGQVQRTKSVVAEARVKAQGTNGQIASLTESATRIGDVVKLISSIAEQTNLLALNATIEAARAGEAGRGFSVVAGEVKNLATQTAKATEDIAKQIAAIQESTADAVGAIQGIVETMEDVDRHTQEIAAAVEQQGSATQEITGSVTDAAHGTALVVGDMSDLNVAVAETSQTASAVLSASGAMRATAEDLRIEVDQFLRGVAAA